MVLWWQTAGEIPTLDEALRRLDLLASEGPGPDAFTFKQRYPAPDDRGLLEQARVADSAVHRLKP
jgi:hypothetical protein